MALDDFERRNWGYFAMIFHRIRQLWGPITSHWLEFKVILSGQKCNPKSLVFCSVRPLTYMYDNIRRDYRERNAQPESENLTCATLRGPLSNS